MITNNSIKSLELKGNNIHGEGTGALAKLLRHNISIKRFFFQFFDYHQPLTSNILVYRLNGTQWD
jgi:hypothetical protein